MLYNIEDLEKDKATGIYEIEMCVKKQFIGNTIQIIEGIIMNYPIKMDKWSLISCKLKKFEEEVKEVGDVWSRNEACEEDLEIFEFGEDKPKIIPQEDKPKLCNVKWPYKESLEKRLAEAENLLRTSYVVVNSNSILAINIKKFLDKQ